MFKNLKKELYIAWQLIKFDYSNYKLKKYIERTPISPMVKDKILIDHEKTFNILRKYLRTNIEKDL